MEKKQKNMVVTFMMVVGVAFILIAGCICVKQAWKYLPETVKQICLLGVGIGALTGSVFAGKTNFLKKTETALFYVGDAFLGYFILSFTGSEMIKNMISLTMWDRLFLVTLIMILPVIVKFIYARTVAEYSMAVILMNLGMIFLLTSMEVKICTYVFGLSLVALLLLLLEQYCKTCSDTNKGLSVCAKVCFLVQEIYTVILLCAGSFVKEITGKEIVVRENITFIVLAVCIVLSGLIWYDKKEKNDVLQLIVLGFLLGNMLIYNMICGQLTDALVLGVVALLILIVAGIHNNRAYVVVSAITLLLIAFYITRAFWLSIAWWVYMFAAGVILVLIAVKKEREGE